MRVDKIILSRIINQWNYNQRSCLNYHGEIMGVLLLSIHSNFSENNHSFSFNKVYPNNEMSLERSRGFYREK